MQYLGRPPVPPLDRFIERIWYCSATPPHTRERVIPGGGTVDLIVNLFADEVQIFHPDEPKVARSHAGTLIQGAYTRSFMVDPRQRASVMGVHFRPGGALPFLGTSPSELVDSHVELRDVWGSSALRLREQLLEASSTAARFAILEAALLQRLRRARPLHPAVAAAVAALAGSGPGARVAAVAAAVGLSPRRFIEVFEREVGLTPKLYARLQRFHRVKQRIAMLGGPPSWASFAIDSGYFDQAHMIREFVEFSGISPAGYLRAGQGETLFDQLVHAYPGSPPP